MIQCKKHFLNKTAMPRLTRSKSSKEVTFIPTRGSGRWMVDGESQPQGGGEVAFPHALSLGALQSSKGAGPGF